MAQPTSLKGAYIEIVHVQDPDGAPTKTTLSFTTDDVELSIDEDEATVNKHSQRQTIRSRTYVTAELTVSSLIEPTLETLDETGMIDSANDGKLEFGTPERTWDAAFFRVFDDPDDTSPQLVHRYDTVEWMISDGVTYPSDFATAGLTGWIHGDIFMDYQES